MTLYAIEDLDDAFVATREFLISPFSLRRWLVLAFVVFFVGGGGVGAGNGFSGVNAATPPATDTDPGVEVGEVVAVLTELLLANLALVLGVLGVLAFFVLGFMFVAATMEFVLVESLRKEEVRLFEYARTNLGKALSLLAFRVVLALLALGIVGGLFVLGLWLVTGAPEGIPPSLLVLLSLVGGLLLLCLSLTDSFTTEFVVPTMLVTDRGLVGGWRAFWPVLLDSWKQYLAYAVAVFVLGIVVSILVGIAVAIVLTGLGLTFGIAGIAVFVLLFAAGAELIGGVLLVLIGLVALALFLVSVALILVPAESYLRYYSLFVLGDTDADLDPIPEVRGSVRERQYT
ncbi:DUF7544 domain-containing protein [Natronorarus salvus]|uniref:DUF7544 domain-containing protein n=1 Tax=Natronorarus salvus TaxID=3117733 RepID=UPI002F2636BD